MKAALIPFVLTTVLSACTSLNGMVASSGPVPTQAADMHTSQNSLDWAGTYEGVLPCADCPGIKTRLTLNKDGTFERMTQYLDRKVAAETVSGSFRWQANGNAITLDEHGEGQQFRVGEGRLILQYPGGESGSPGPNMMLMLVLQTAKEKSLAQALEDHNWTLESATDGKSRPIVSLASNKDRPIELSFSGNRFSIQAPCNRMMGGYHVNDANQLTVSAAASTMMACSPALMHGDAALSSILSELMKVEFVDGPSPQLRLISASKETLTFTGHPTPESLYGPGTRMFLEVAAQPVACEHPPAPSTNCLQVREIHFDEQGLRSGPPGEWQTLHENIEGFTHTEGTRNIVRVKRFDRGQVSAGESPTLYVLDLVVESETVTP